MRRRDLTVRAAGLVLTGELAVHELRYLIAPARPSEHGYLPLFGIVSVLVLAVAAGRLAGMLESARRTGRHEGRALAFRTVWPLLAMAIVVVFGVQETAEGLAAGAGAAALPAAFTNGGWLALPLALAIAGVLALALTGAGAAVEAAARAMRAAVGRRRPAGRSLGHPHRKALPCPLAVNLAGRAPPLAS